MFFPAQTAPVFSLINRALLAAVFFLCSGRALFAQSSTIIADEQLQMVQYTGSYQDLFIPFNTYIQQISFYIKGGSGGVATTTRDEYPNIDAGTTPAGQGATVLSTYTVGDEPGQIKPGSFIRFIIGGHGETAFFDDDQSAGGGGGASAVLIRQPGEPNFTHLLIAGGGGGACRGVEHHDDNSSYTHKSPGIPGQATDTGTDGAGDHPGSAGTDANGGGSGEVNWGETPISCGGGGYLSTGTNNDCGQGAGHKAHASGAPGGFGNCEFSAFIAGGYGYGSGGAGVEINLYVTDNYYSGGGGGGFAGGGGGDAQWGGGGGGGSAISYDKFYQVPNSNAIAAGGTVMTNEHGEGAYQCKLPTVTATCQNVTLQMQYVPNVVLNPYDVVGENGPSGFSYSLSQNIFDCSDIGQTIPVTLTATGIAGNTAQCTAYITVEDHSIPLITCPANVTQDNDPGVCGATVNYGDWSYNDNCGATVALEAGLPKGSLFPVGITALAYRATDLAGNSSTCSFSVTVKDAQKPAIACPADIVQNNDPGVCGATVSFTANATDNCDVASVQQTVGPVSNSVFPLGLSTVVFKTIDFSGNWVACSFTVTVQDKESPSIVCKNAVVTLNAAGQSGISISDVFQSGTDNCGTMNLVSVAPNAFTCNNLGENAVLLTAVDGHGNSATCTAFVTVEDHLAPVLLCKTATITLDASGNAALSVAQIDNGSFDNCAITALNLNQTAFTCANLGTNTVLLSGTDQSGNKNTCTAEITVKDATAPTALCKNLTVNLNAAGQAFVAAPAVDNGSADVCGIAAMTLTPNTFSCADVGVNTVVLIVADPGGNTAACSATITVKDATAPQAKCKNISAFLDGSGHASITASSVNNGSSDACGIAAMTINAGNFDCGQLNTSVPVWLTVKDAHNNTATCQANVTVKDNLAPTAVCTNTTVQLNAQGKAFVYGATLAQDSYDNCSVWSYSPVSKQYTAANLGVNNLTITVKDWSGNAAACVSQVTVQPYGGGQLVGQINDTAGENPDAEPAEARNEVAATEVAVQVFPNPAVGDATVSFQLPADQQVSLRVFDQGGRLVLRQDLAGTAGENRATLALTGMPAGLYLVDFQAGEQYVQKRLAVPRP